MSWAVSAGCCRLRCHQALNDAPFRALEAIDPETFCHHVIERLAQEMIPVQPNEDRVQQLLERSHRQARAADVLEQEESSARPQNPPRFRDGLAVIGD